MGVWPYPNAVGDRGGLTTPLVASRPLRAKSRKFCGNSWGLWLLVEGIHTDIWVVSETKIHAENGGNFQIGVEMRGKFPQICKLFYSPKNDIKSSLGYFHTTGTLPMSLYCILKFEGKLEGNIPMGFPRERRRRYPHRKFPFIFPNFLREIVRRFHQG